MKKRIVTALAVMALVLSAAALAFAGQASPVEDFAYYVSGDHVVITAYLGTSLEVVVPEEIEGKPVTSVALGHSYYSQDDNTFFPYVRQVTLPPTVKKLGDFAFGFCTDLRQVNGLEYIEELGDDVFLYAPLTEAVFSQALRSISPTAFSNAPELKRLTIPDDIRLDTSGGTTNLRLASLEQLTLIRGKGERTMVEEEGVLFSADGKTLMYVLPYMNKAVYRIPEGTEVIGSGALTDNLLVDEYEFPASVSFIPFGDDFDKRLTMVVHQGSYAHSFFENYNTDTTYVRPQVKIRIVGDDPGDSLQALTEGIVAQVITEGMTDVQKARALHDWILANGSYDYTYEREDARAILSGGSGVCDAYARAYCVLLEAVGIDSRRVTCALNGVGHAINAVLLGGEWYLVDCTNDDEGFGHPDELFLFDRRMFDRLYTGTVGVDAGSLDLYPPLREGRLAAAEAKLEGLIQAQLDRGATTFTVSLEGQSRPDQILSEALCVLMEEREWNCGGTPYSLQCRLYEGDGFLCVLQAEAQATYLYREEGDGVCLTKYSGSEETVLVPAVWEGKRVVALDYTFADNSWIKSVIIPEGVTRIGNSVFYNCPNLESVSLPSTVTAIGSDAFCLCTALSGEIRLTDRLETLGDFAFQSCVSLQRITLPGSLTSIGEDIFADCSSLSEVTLLPGFGEITDGMFFRCISLKHLQLPEGVRSIGDSAFSNSSVVSLSLPATVSQVHAHAFVEARRLKTLTVHRDNPALRAVNGMLITRDTGVLMAVAPEAAGSDVRIPEGVRAIAPAVFALNETIRSVHIPGSVKTVGSKAFIASGILHVTMEDGVETIGDYAFAGASYSCRHFVVYGDGSALTTVRIPNTVTSIGECAFIGNNCLRELILPSSVTRIEHQIINFPEDLYVPASVTYIAPQTMLYNWGENVIHGIPGTYAETYANENGFRFVDVGGSLTLNRTEADLVIGESLPLSLVAVSGSADLPQAEEITWSSSDPCVTVDENGVITGISGGEAVITAQAEGCAAACTVRVLVSAEPAYESMTYVANFGNTVMVVGGESRSMCADSVFILPDGSQSGITWGRHARWWVSDPERIRLEPNGEDYMSAVAIGPGECTIFAQLPDGLTASFTFIVTGRAFIDDSVVDPETIEAWLILPGGIRDIEEEAFLGAAAAGVRIPEGARTIGPRAFAGMTSLQYVRIPASVTAIAEDAFQGCGKITLAGDSDLVREYAQAHGYPLAEEP